MIAVPRFTHDPEGYFTGTVNDTFALVITKQPRGLCVN